MQTRMDIVRSYYSAINYCDLEKAGGYLAEDFRQFGPSSLSMGKCETLEALRSLITAMPDLKYALSSVNEEGPVVSLTVQAGGRHTQPLDLSRLGMGLEGGVVPGSGRVIIFLPSDLKYTVIHEKIVSEHNVTVPTLYNGVNGFLHAIGFSGYAF